MLEASSSRRRPMPRRVCYVSRSGGILALRRDSVRLERGRNAGISREQVAHPLQGSGFVVARTGSAARLTACTWVSSKWAGRAPQGSVLLRAFLGGANDPVRDRSLGRRPHRHRRTRALDRARHIGRCRCSRGSIAGAMQARSTMSDTPTDRTTRSAPRAASRAVRRGQRISGRRDPGLRRGWRGPRRPRRREFVRQRAADRAGVRSNSGDCATRSPRPRS